MLQLPLDVWRDILRGLPRGYIDQLIDLDRATHVAINAISEPNKDGPLRTILLEVYARGGKHHHIYVAKCRQNHANPNEEALDIGYRIRCTTSMQLFRAMKDSVVRNAWYARLPRFVSLWRFSGSTMLTSRSAPSSAHMYADGATGAGFTECLEPTRPPHSFDASSKNSFSPPAA